MCVTTTWARSSGPIPSSASPSPTASRDRLGPVSTSAGSSPWRRYADVTISRPSILVSIPLMAGAAWKVTFTGPVYGRRHDDDPNRASVPRGSVRPERRTNVIMVSVNVVVLAGRLSDAPELKTMPSGDQVARFRLAIPEEGKRLL